MAKAIICVKECGLNPVNNKANIVYDFSTDYLSPNVGVPLTIGDLRMDITLGNSVTQINNSIKSGVLTMLVEQGFPNTLLTVSDITIFGGAQ